MATGNIPEPTPSPWKTAVSGALVAALIFAVALAIFEPAWQNPYDPRMALKVSGIASLLEAEPHLLYTHFWLGSGLPKL